MFKSMSVYTVTSLVNAAIPFLLLPILTHYLTPADYGVLSVVMALVSFVFPLTVMGVGTAIYIEFFKMPKEDFPTYVRSVLSVPVFCTVILVVIFLLFGTLLNRFTTIPLDWLLVIPLLVLIQVVPYIVSLLYQVRQEVVRYGKFQVGLTALNLSASLIFIVLLHMGWKGRLYGIYGAYLVFALLGFYELSRMGYLKCCIQLKHIKSALIIGIPLIPHEVGTTIINLSDRLFISKMVGVEAVGYYSIGYQVGMIVYLLSTSFNQAWAPYLFENLRDAGEETKKKMVQQSYLVVVLLFASLGVLYLLTPYLFKVFIHERFGGAAEYVFWVALGHVFFGMYILVVNYIYYVKKTFLLTYLTFGTGIANLLLNYLLIRQYGAIGAAYATALSYCAFFLLAWWLSQRVFPMPWFSFYKKA